MAVQNCPFCPPPDARVFHRTKLIIGFWDGFPLSPGHALLVPERHIASWFDATPDEQAALMMGISEVRRVILKEHAPDGFNIGVNVGEAAGQTVPHLHLHVIPRYRGDVADPRGGIRWVIPERATYWKKKPEPQ